MDLVSKIRKINNQKVKHVKLMENKGLLVMIDDDEDDHEIFEMAMRDINSTFEILHFSDCEQVLKHFSTPGVKEPDFVFIDINLPRISGGDCLEKLQNLRRFDNPRIIIYSSVIPAERKKKLQQIGVDDFLEKTGSLQHLEEQLVILFQKV